MSSKATEAALALRKRVVDTLAAKGHAIDLALDGWAYDAAGKTMWLEESIVGGTSRVVELGAGNALPLREHEEQTQYLLRAPAGQGYAALRTILDELEAGLRTPSVFLRDGVTPVVVDDVTVGSLRPIGEHGKVSMPLVVSYHFTSI